MNPLQQPPWNMFPPTVPAQPPTRLLLSHVLPNSCVVGMAERVCLTRALYWSVLSLAVETFCFCKRTEQAPRGAGSINKPNLCHSIFVSSDIRKWAGFLPEASFLQSQLGYKREHPFPKSAFVCLSLWLLLFSLSNVTGFGFLLICQAGFPHGNFFLELFHCYPRILPTSAHL